MKFLFKLIFKLLLLVVVVAAALGFLYVKFFNPQPADYPYLNSVDQIKSIEIAEISFEGGSPSPTGIGVITDKEAFINDLNQLQCSKGLDLNSIGVLSSNQSIEGIVIHYQDGTSQIITAYISVNIGAESSGLYSFDVEEFSEMLDEYKDLYTEDIDGLNKFPSLDGIEIPDLDGIEIPDLDGIEIPDGIGQ